MKISKKKTPIDSDQEQSTSRLNNTQATIIYNSNLSQNASQRKNGQTMFQFLKRRKKYALQKQVQKSSKLLKSPNQVQQEIITPENRSFYQSVTKTPVQNKTPMNKLNNLDLDLSQIKPRITKKKSVHDSFALPQDIQQRFNEKSSKKVTFRQSQPQNTYRQGYSTYRQLGQSSKNFKIDQSFTQKKNKSFYDIMSPFKKRISSTNKKKYQIDKDSQQQQNKNSFCIQSSKKAPKVRQTNVQGQNILNSIQQFTQKLFGYINKGKSFKIKSQGLVLQCLQILKYFQQNCRDKNSLRKIGQLRSNSKIVQKLYNDFELMNIEQSLDKLHNCVVEKISIIQKECNKEFQSELNLFKKSSIDNYEKQIQQLEQRYDNLSKQSEKNEKKMRKQIGYYKFNFQNLNVDGQQQLKNHRQKVLKLQNQLENSKASQKSLKQTIQQKQQFIQKLSKQNKTIQYQKLSLLKSFEIQKQTINATRQNILLQEINQLKKGFQHDIADIKSLYAIKQNQLNQQIQKLQKKIKQIESKSKSYNNIQANLYQQIDILKGKLERQKCENSKYLRQLDSINNELYLYWTGLKDIKILSSRLGLYNKFMRIYDDIRFSDTMFK